MTVINYCKAMWQLALQGEAQGIWFYSALYALIVCSYSLAFQIRTRYWPHVAGELISLGVEKFGASDRIKSKQDYIADALYTYQVAGTDYSGSRISPWIFVASHNAKFILEKQLSLIQQLPNGKVKVFFDPKNPKKSFLMVAGTTGIFITLALGGLPLVAFYIKYYAHFL